MSDRIVVGACEACGTELHAPGKEYWQQADYAEIPIAPGITALSCAKSLGHRGEPSRDPKGACARRIRQKRGLCPGCGARDRSDMAYFGVLCEACKATLARTREAESKRAVAWRRILTSGLAPHLPGDLCARAALALAEAVSGGRRWLPAADGIYVPPDHCVAGNDSRATSAADPIVEMDEAQAAALRRFLEIVYQVAETERARGFEEGDNLLRRLAKGDVKPSEYEQWSPQSHTRR